MDQSNPEKLTVENYTRYLSSSRKCFVGCDRSNGQPLHLFPKDPKRRAEWFKLLGISSKNKYLYLCGAHFPPNYTFGKRINSHVFPKPREKDPANTIEIQQKQATKPTTTKSSSKPKEKQNQEVKPKVFQLHNQQKESSIPKTTKSSSKPEEKQNQEVNPEVFELRVPASGSNKLLGCYYETDDFLMVSYTQTNKLTHEEQVSLLNQKYEEQAKIIGHLKRENYILSKAVRTHQILFSQLRKIKSKNRIIRKSIKKLIVKKRNLEKSLRKEIVDNK